MASAIAFAPVGTHLREFWVTIAKTLSIRGDEVYFFDPNPLLRRLLKQEGLSDTVIRFDGDQTAPLPLSTDRDVYIVDHNLRNLNKSYRTIQSDYANFNRYFNQLDIDVCVFWNDYRSPGAISPDRHDVEYLYMENGYMPETIQMDSAGVNRNTTVAGQSKADVIKREQLHKVSPDLDVADVEPLSPTDIAIGFGVKAFTNPSAAFRSLKHRIPPHEELLPELDSQPTLPESFVFVPFQVHDDTQIRYNSPLVDDMRTFLTVVRQAVDAVAPEQTVVVKEHPVDLHRMDYSHLRSQFSDVCWFTEYPIEELITKANTVVTINSSVGFQSITKGTPVVTVGMSLYDSAPNVWSVNELNEIDEALNAALTSNPDDDLVAEYVEAVQDMLFVPGTPGEFSGETIRHIIGYIDYLSS